MRGVEQAMRSLAAEQSSNRDAFVGRNAAGGEAAGTHAGRDGRQAEGISAHGGARPFAGHVRLLAEGFVSVLSTLLLVITFMLSIFMLGQFYLGQQLNSRDQSIVQLQARIADLASQLGLAKKAASDQATETERLRATLAEAEEARAAGVIRRRPTSRRSKAN